tara:strand:+ start:162 stop:368 length:207 start_codon:yes stop_codon:yes gene_type:complete
MKRIKHNDLLPWFIRDHGTLPASYLKSCRKFFKSLKPQAASCKRQAASLTRKYYNDIQSYKLKEKDYD